jgi:hypothetical protein
MIQSDHEYSSESDPSLCSENVYLLLHHEEQEHPKLTFSERHLNSRHRIGKHL